MAARRSQAGAAKQKPRTDPQQKLRVVEVPLSKLRPASWNPRLITPKAQKNIEAGLDEFGLVDPIIARREDGLVVGGHQRLELLRRRGRKTAPVIYLTGLNDARAKALNILLNNDEAAGRFDPGALALLLREVSAAGKAGATGYDDGAIERLLAAAAPAPPEEFAVVPGQVSTAYTCPQCGYGWSGKPKAGKVGKR